MGLRTHCRSEAETCGLSSRASAEFRRSGADGAKRQPRTRLRGQRNRERKGLLNKQDCERFATYDTMKAPQEHEPEHGLRGADTHDGVARAGGFECGGIS